MFHCKHMSKARLFETWSLQGIGLGRYLLIGDKGNGDGGHHLDIVGHQTLQWTQQSSPG